MQQCLCGIYFFGNKWFVAPAGSAQHPWQQLRGFCPAASRLLPSGFAASAQHPSSTQRRGPCPDFRGQEGSADAAPPQHQQPPGGQKCQRVLRRPGWRRRRRQGRKHCPRRRHDRQPQEGARGRPAARRDRGCGLQDIRPSAGPAGRSGARRRAATARSRQRLGQCARDLDGVAREGEPPSLACKLLATPGVPSDPAVWSSACSTATMG